MKAKPKLKPCPFCGNKDIFFDRCTSHIMCIKCGAKAPFISKFMTPERTESEAAIAAWNTRAYEGNEE